MSDNPTQNHPNPTGPPAADAPARPRLRTVARWLAVSTIVIVGLLIALIIGWQASPQLSRAWRSVAPDAQSDPLSDDAGAAQEGQWYISGMHPWIVSPEPGNCPICGMELTPLDPNQLAARIAIDPTVIQNIGLTTTAVTQGPLTQDIRTVGNITYAQDAVRSVNLRTGGWVRQLHVDRLGQRVVAGQPLLTLYAPELIAAQQEYLVALRSAKAAQAHDHILGSPADSQRLVEAARRRLLYLGLTEDQVAQLTQAATSNTSEGNSAAATDGEDDPAQAVQDTVTIHSPHDGVVTGKAVNEGQRVEPGLELFQIANLNSVWVQATLYEQHLGAVSEGMQASVTVPQLPSETFEGVVAQVYPYMADVGRSARVRVELANPDGQLRPGMFATVHFTGQVDGDALVTLVPREAVLVTGDRAIAFVQQGQGEFEPRNVTLGRTTDAGLVHITSGLEPGEQVVVNGIFLLDSEARTREGLAKMMGGSADRSNTPATPRPSAIEPGAWLDLTAEQQATIDRVFAAYFEVASHLAGNHGQAAAQAMSKLRTAAGTMEAAAPQPARTALEAIASVAAPGDDQDPADLDALRARIERITVHATSLAEVAPPTRAVAPAVYRTYCPMVKKHWLQDTPTIRNLYAPYMLTCGEVVEQFPTRPSVAPADDGQGGVP